MKASGLFGNPLSILLALSSVTACSGAPPETPVPETTKSQASDIHANPGSTITKSTEPNSQTGQFPQVMLVTSNMGTCTGTVIAPYTVLSAAHCDFPGTSIAWNSDSHAAIGFDNPYHSAAFEPSWVVALNEPPGMHDQTVFFVADLTPRFLSAHQINPIAINPHFPFPGSFTVVGVGSTNGTTRDSIAEEFVEPNAQPASYPEDGYLTCDDVTPNLGTVDHGDSGGPHIGTGLSTWIDGSTFATGSTVVATSVLSGCESAPLSYSAGITETANQQSTVRLNSLWAMARADDADGDGLPNECDSDPTTTSSVNLCPAPLGAPVGTATASVPAAQLQCPFGTMPVGVQGLFGTSLNRIEVQCDQLQCFAGTACSGTRTLTDPFGPSVGGSSLNSSCAEGERMVGLSGTSDASGIYSLTAQCLTAAGTVHPAGTNGNTAKGSPFAFTCPANKLTGFEARSTSATSTTGLQALCLPVTEVYSVGPGPAQNPMRCPPGQVALGVGYSAPSTGAGAEIQMTGLLCGDKASIAAGQPMGNIPLTVLRSGFEMGDWFDPAVEPHATVHVPPTWKETYCPTGSAMSGLTVGWDAVSYPGLAFVSGIQQMQCQNIQSSAGAATTVAINAGNLSGLPTYALTVSPSVVDGFVTCDAQSECGMSLHGSGPPAPPADLTVTNAASTGVTLVWQASTTPNVAYRVFRSTNGSFTPDSTTKGIGPDVTALTFTDTTPTPSANNFYFVAAVTGDGMSFVSNQLALAVPALPAVTGLVATAQFNQTLFEDTITLSWNAAMGVTTPVYNIYRNTTASFTPSSATLLTSTIATTFVDDGSLAPAADLTGGTTYYYFVEISQSGGTSPPSNEASAKAPTFNVPAPMNLGATSKFDPSLGFDTITLTWTPVAETGALYDIYRSATASFTPSSANMAYSTYSTSFEDDGTSTGTFLAGETFYYYVDVDPRGGTSLRSNEASVTTPGFQIDCGSTSGVAPYVADEFFSGAGGTINHNNNIILTGVTNPAPMAVYQTARLGPITYKFSALFVPGSTHTIRLHFAETWATAKGMRVFNVLINGKTVLPQFDIFAVAGGENKALVEPFSVAADSSGTYTIQFTNMTNNALISAIEIQ